MAARILCGMTRFALPVLFLVAACGGGGGAAPVETTSTESQTLGERLGDCFVRDVTDLAGLLELLTGVLGENDGALPQPELDLAGFLTSGGALPLAWDLDDDGTPELDGTLRYIDEEGDTTFPFTLGDLLNIDPNDPATLLAATPDGSRLEIQFRLDGLLTATAGDATIDGTIILTFEGGAPVSAQGAGRFVSDECSLTFDLDEIPVAFEGLDRLPELEFGFTAALDPDRVEGIVDFDGMGTASVRGRINDGPEESFSFEVPAGIGGIDR